MTLRRKIGLILPAKEIKKKRYVTCWEVNRIRKNAKSWKLCSLILKGKAIMNVIHPYNKNVVGSQHRAGTELTKKISARPQRA